MPHYDYSARRFVRHRGRPAPASGRDVLQPVSVTHPPFPVPAKRPRGKRCVNPAAASRSAARWMPASSMFDSPLVKSLGRLRRLRQALVREGPPQPRGRARLAARITAISDSTRRPHIATPRRTCSSAGAASARTSLNSRSPACGRSALPAATSAAYLETDPPPASLDSPERTRPTPGFVLLPRHRLDPTSSQTISCPHRAYHGRLGPRLQRRQSPARHYPRQRRAHPESGGGRGARADSDAAITLPPPACHEHASASAPILFSGHRSPRTAFTVNMPG